MFISGRGSNLKTILDKIDNKEIDGEVKVVISDREKAKGLSYVEKKDIQGIYIGNNNYNNSFERTEKTLEILKKNDIDLIVLAGYMSIIPKKIVEKYRNRIINIHPSLIPSFCGKGYYGKKVHEKVVEYGVKITGATVHFVDEGTDTGPIILQKPVEVYFNDTVESLSKRVLDVEHKILPLAIKLFTEDRIHVKGRKVKIYYK